MKKFLSKLSLMKIVTAVVVLILLIVFVSRLPQLAMKSDTIPTVVNAGIAEAGEVIAKDAGEVWITNNGGKTLYLDPATLKVKVVDDATGMMWTSSPSEGDLTEDEEAPMYISFLDATGALSEWDAYTYCLANDNTTRELEEGESLADTYSITRIDNGFRATLNITEIESTVLDEYMPKQISVDRYQECFIDKIDENVANGKFTEEQAERYNKALSMIYAIDDTTGDYYYNKYAGTPPVTVTTILIDLAKKVNYTTADLVADSREFNLVVTISHSADFTIVMDVTLDDGDLVVTVPTYEIKDNSIEEEDTEEATEAEDDGTESSTDYYTLQSITIFPNFGLADATKCENGGFIFVPDGSGALFDLNTYNNKYVSYSRPVYNNTYYDEMYSQSEYKEDLMMPVFGLGKADADYYEAPASEEDASEVEESEDAEEEAAEESEEAEETENSEDTGYSGFMAIIESGAETASISVVLGTPDTSNGGTTFNKVYASFDVIQYSNVKVFGAYSDSDAKFLATTDQFDVDLTIRYKLYTENCNYYTMAQDYKTYLIQTNTVDVSYAEAPELFLDVVSSLTYEDRIMGIPYDKTISMTTYSELKSILEDLVGIDKVVSYKGAYNGGIYNKVNLDAKKTSANGSESDYNSLMAVYGDSIYMSTPIARVYKDSAIWNPSSHGLLGYDSDEVQIFDYDIPTGRFNTNGQGYWIVAPKYLNHVVTSFLKDAGSVNLSIEDLGNVVYANYRKSDEVSLYEGELVVQNALTQISEDRNIILYNPFANRMLYAEYCADISRESSDYGLIAHNVPFRQLVMNGLTKYTTLDVNESSSSKDYYLLQAVELGSCPKFKVTAKSVDQLKENNYNLLFSTEYDIIKDDIKYVMEAVEDAFAQIGTTEIKGHEILEDKVYMTTYASGVKVVTNYNTYPVNVDGFGKIASMGYVIAEGGAVNE